MDNYWDEAFGTEDRIVLLVLHQKWIKRITARLNACLLEDFSLNSGSKEAYRDPFPAWFQQTSS